MFSSPPSKGSWIVTGLDEGFVRLTIFPSICPHTGGKARGLSSFWVPTPLMPLLWFLEWLIHPVPHLAGIPDSSWSTPWFDR